VLRFSSVKKIKLLAKSKTLSVLSIYSKKKLYIQSTPLSIIIIYCIPSRGKLNCALAPKIIVINNVVQQKDVSVFIRFGCLCDPKQPTISIGSAAAAAAE